MIARHVSIEQLNACHVAVVRRFPAARFRIVESGGAVHKFNAALALRWLERNGMIRRWLHILPERKR